MNITLLGQLFAMIAFVFSYLYSDERPPSPCINFSDQWDAKAALPSFANEVSYTTAQETTQLLVAQDASLSLVAGDIEYALAYLEKETSRWQHVPRLKTKVLRKGLHGTVRVECLKSLNASVIYLPEKHYFIGEGGHKTVIKALFIRNAKVAISVHCWAGRSAEQEIRALASLRGQNGIVPFLGAVSRERGAHFSIFLLYCNGGDLRKFIGKKKRTETFYQELLVARDAVLGLKVVHGMGYIHFDLHSGNIFMLRDTNGVFHGFLGDFGQAFLARRSGSRPGYVTTGRIPPEVLKTDIDKIDRYKTDIYALGTVFYRIAWRGGMSWADVIPDAKVHMEARARKSKYYKQIVQLYLSHQDREVAPILTKQKTSGAESLTAEERFKLLTHAMLHYQPSKRPTLDMIIQELEAILALLVRDLKRPSEQPSMASSFLCDTVFAISAA